LSDEIDGFGNFVEHFSLPIAEKCSRINTAARARTEHTGRDTTGRRNMRACHSLGGANGRLREGGKRQERRLAFYRVNRKSML
jgi:hypothetical protein